jgi:hypothetical protein
MWIRQMATASVTEMMMMNQRNGMSDLVCFIVFVYIHKYDSVRKTRFFLPYCSILRANLGAT